MDHPHTEQCDPAYPFQNKMTLLLSARRAYLIFQHSLAGHQAKHNVAHRDNHKSPDEHDSNAAHRLLHECAQEGMRIEESNQNQRECSVDLSQLPDHIKRASSM